MRDFLFASISLFIFLITTNLAGQYCNPFEFEETEFQAETRIVKVNMGWYPGWLEHHEGKLKYHVPLLPLEKWKHPFMKDNLSSAMHEDSYASDISNMQGPVPENPTVQYFQVREKGDLLVEGIKAKEGRNKLTAVIPDAQGNIWATYTFGPNNSIYIGAYRGFLKFSSDPKPE